MKSMACNLRLSFMQKNLLHVWFNGRKSRLGLGMSGFQAKPVEHPMQSCRLLGHM